MATTPAVVTSAIDADATAAALPEQPEENKADPSIGNCWGRTNERTLWTRLWQVVAGASLVVNLVAMAVTGAAAHVLVAGIVACIVAPIVFYLQFQLEDTECTYIRLYIAARPAWRVLFRLICYGAAQFAITERLTWKEKQSENHLAV